MPSGGARKGAGRKKGSVTKNSKKRAYLQAAAAGGIMPLDYLLATVRNENLDHSLRIAASIAAAPYVHSRLAPVSPPQPKPQPVAPRIEIVLVRPEPRMIEIEPPRNGH